MDLTKISCGDATVSFVEVLGRNSKRKAGMQYPFNLSPIQAEKLMQTPSSNFMVRIDLFSMLRTLIMRLSRMLDEHCVQSTRFLRNVKSNIIK